MPEKVAIFMQDLAGGGAERMMLNLAHGIADLGHRVDLVLVRSDGAYQAPAHDNIAMVPLGTGRVIWSVPALARYLRRSRPAALLSALANVNIAAILAHRLAGRPCRLVISERNHVSQAAPGAKDATLRWAYQLQPWLYPLADAIVAVSDGVADDLAAVTGLARGRITQLNNPVVGPGLLKSAEARPDHPWFADRGPPVIIAAGRFRPQKDFPTLLRAFALVRAQVPARLILLGDGPDAAALTGLVAELGLQDAVDMPGFSDNVYGYMAAADMFVLSSRWEGSPNVVVEALACGTAVVATDCPSGPREILQAGAIAPLAPVGDAGALAEAMLQMLRQPPDPEIGKRRAADFSVLGASRAYLSVMLPNGAV